MNTYNFQSHTIELEGEEFNVYRHKTGNSLMISPAFSTPQVPPKFVTPLTLDQKLLSIAKLYLAATEQKSCKVTQGKPLQGQIYEFWFECTG